MATLQQQKIDKEFFAIERLSRKKKKGDEIIHMQILQEDIQRFLLEKIREQSLPHFQEVQGHYKPFTLYPNPASGELGVLGGQVSRFAFSNKTKDEGFLLGIDGSFQEQAEGFWKWMDPEKGFLEIHFVFYTGPRKATGKEFMERGVYEGSEMCMFRISFRLRRESSSDDIVLLYDLKIVEEQWKRTHIKDVVLG